MGTEDMTRLPSSPGAGLSSRSIDECEGLSLQILQNSSPAHTACLSPSRQAAHTLPPLHPDAKAPAAAPVPGIALTAAGKVLCPEGTGQGAEGGWAWAT